MSKTSAIIGLIVLVAVGGFLLFNKKKTPESTTPTFTTETNTYVPDTNSQDFLATPEPQTVAVTYTNTGFSPATVTINKGDTVTFENKGTQNMWVASNPHPAHTDYSVFDAKRSYTPGESYSFTFSETGTFPFHDHSHSSLGGTIIVVAGDK